MKLSDAQKAELAWIVKECCAAVLRQHQFNAAYQSGWLSPDDTSTVYRKTLRTVENKSHLCSFKQYVSCVATNEAKRYFRAVLVKERQRHEKHFSFDDAILNTNHVSHDPITSDPAVLAEKRDLHEKVRSLLRRLPPDEATVVLIWKNSDHGDGALDSAAQQLGISRSAVYKLRASALTRIREWLPEMERTWFAP